MLHVKLWKVDATITDSPLNLQQERRDSPKSLLIS
jgi:hypothetical protein